VFSYNMKKIVSSSEKSNCGQATIVFMTTNDLPLASVFTQECTDEQCSLSVFDSVIESCGSYEMYFKFYYSGMPSVYVTSDVFSVTVINPCLPPVDCLSIEGCGLTIPEVHAPTESIKISYTVA